ncbi:MAG: hypothetical protein NC184_01245 [Roseburia sp.]|nr:hypothetical protein [Roseburia sp.]
MKKIRLLICVLLTFVMIFAAYPIGAAAEADGESVYIGGFPVGISLDIGGLLIESVTGVETEYGTAYVDGLEQGDIIKKVNGQSVKTVADMQGLLTGGDVTIELLRDGDTVIADIRPIVEAYTAMPRLGVKIKEKIYGVGTVTFVRADGTYTALGHEIRDSDVDFDIPFAGGNIHACKILGIKRGKKGEAGAILASVIPEKIYGTVTCNNNFGIAGKYSTELHIEDRIDVAERSEVKPGAAKIRTTVNGNAEYFDIEIIKASKQNGKREKGLVFRVTDERLLELTGGVVRGMSGSPIIQNGKLVGAVTHVFLNDFTKGYGVYADCLN